MITVAVISPYRFLETINKVITDHDFDCAFHSYSYECIIAVGMKGTVKVVSGNDFVDGFQKPKRADNSNGNHGIPPLIGTNQELFIQYSTFSGKCNRWKSEQID